MPPPGGSDLEGCHPLKLPDLSEGQRGANLSLLGVSFGIGAVTMPVTLALLSETYELNAIVATIGGLVLVPAVYCLVIAFPPPKRRAEKFSPADTLRLVRDPIFFFAGFALAIQSGMEGMSNDWITLYFQDVTLAVGDAFRITPGTVHYMEAVTDCDVREAISEPIRLIVGAVRDALERVPPELSADLYDRGVVLTGGGALLEGLPDYLQRELDLVVKVADDPRFAIVRGLAQLYEEPLLLRRVARTDPHPLLDAEAAAFET